MVSRYYDKMTMCIHCDDENESRLDVWECGENRQTDSLHAWNSSFTEVILYGKWQ